MSKIKIHEIAKKIGVASKQVLAMAHEIGINVTSHLSGVEENDEKRILEAFENNVQIKEEKNESVKEQKQNKKSKNKKSPKMGNHDGKKSNSPVIIRREVIVESEPKKEKENVTKEEKNSNIGFVERNHDYNIVYRNKKQKPLSANELFGIKNEKDDKTKKDKKNELTDKKSKNEEKNIEESIEENANKNELGVEQKEIDMIMKQEVLEKSDSIVSDDKIDNKDKQDQIYYDNKENENDFNLDYNKEKRHRKFNKEENGEREYRRRNRDENGEEGYRKFNRDENGERRYRKYNRDENGERGYRRRNRDENGEEGYSRYNRDENGGEEGYRKFNKDENGERGYRRRNRDENGEEGYRRYNRDENGERGYRRYNRDENGEEGYRKFNKDENGERGYRRYNKDENGERGYRKFNKDDDERNNSSNNRNNNGKTGNNNYRNNRKPLDEKGIDKNIKNIISTDIVEKENQRDYSTKSIDKQKLDNKFEDNTNKKQNKSRKNNRFEKIDGGKLKNLKQVDRLSNMFEDQDGGMLDYYDLSNGRNKKTKKKNAKNNEQPSKQKIFKLTEITIPESITVKDLATELKKTSAEVIKKLFELGIMATINNEIDFDTAYLVSGEFGVTANKKVEVKEEDILFDESEDKKEELQSRPPVVVVMGHVDHGKTSLLDAIRSTNVIEGEAGGITQHIGAYKVNVNNREITFLDTPGHEAFTAMRARGAQITDIAILVVAADDGVMPQTIEAINHAKAADIPIVVAVNKIDLPGANVDRIKQELMNYELVPEEWGGDTIYVPISAKNKVNIDTLLEMVLLVADMKELKANPNKQAKGAVIEARLDKAKGPIASMLVQRGTLNIGDTIVVGTSIGRIRAMKNDKGQKVKTAGPSTPVEVLGLVEVPKAGDTFYEVKNEKMAKHLIERRKRQAREQAIGEQNKVTLENLFEKMENENLKTLNIIVKADVQGTAQAVKQSMEKLSNEEVRVKVIHAIAGGVTESDVQLAKASNSIIIAFNVRPVGTAKEVAEQESVEIKQYSVIYKAIEDIEAAMKGMLDPIYEEKNIGNAEVRQTFKVSNVGTIAGCYVLDGKIERNAGVRIIRDSVVIHEGKLASLKRFKDDVKEVAKGYECGVQIENYNDLKEQDIIEFFVMEQVKR